MSGRLQYCAITKLTLYNTFFNFKLHLCHLMVLFSITVVTGVYKNGSSSLQGVPESHMPLHQCPPTDSSSRILPTGMVDRFAENKLRQAVYVQSSSV